MLYQIIPEFKVLNKFKNKILIIVGFAINGSLLIIQVRN